MGIYQTIVCDPPWPEYGGGKIRRGADKHYPLMSVQEIMNLKDVVTGLRAENCHLYLWVTNTYLPAGLEVMRHWGFVYRTCITWAKPSMGLGQYYRGQTEQCLFGITGMLPYRTRDDGGAQGTFAQTGGDVRYDRAGIPSTVFGDVRPPSAAWMGCVGRCCGRRGRSSIMTTPPALPELVNAPRDWIWSWKAGREVHLVREELSGVDPMQTACGVTVRGLYRTFAFQIGGYSAGRCQDCLKEVRREA